MKRKALFRTGSPARRVGGLAAAVFLVAGCADSAEPTGPVDAPPGERSQSTRVVYNDAPLELGVSVSASAISPGDTLHIELSVTNVRGQAVQVSFGSTCQLVYGIESPDGVLIVPPGGGWVCGAMITYLNLDPHESRTQTVTWDGHRYDAETASWKPVPPGTYRVFSALGQGMALQSGAVRVEVGD